MLIVLILAAAALLLADLRARRVDDEIAAVLEHSQAAVKTMKQARRAFNRDLENIGRTGPRGYQSFLDKHHERLRKNAYFEADMMEHKYRYSGCRDLIRITTRYIGLHTVMDLTIRAQVEATLYARDAGDALIRPAAAMDLVARDIAAAEKAMREQSEALSGLTWWQRVRLSPHAETPVEMSKRPNIVIILVDALRADAVGPDTPFLQRLSQRGVTFENAQAPAVVTHVSVASLFSGLDPFEANALGEKNWDHKRSLVHEFRKAGYQTIGISANTLISGENKYNAGFDTFITRFWPPGVVMVNELRSLINADGVHRRPFFLYVHLIDPHDPYASPDSIQALSSKPRPDGMIPDPNVIRKEYIEKGLDPLEELPEGNAEYLRSLYDQEAVYADKWTQKFHELLEMRGMLDNTLFIVTADHGEQFLEHGEVKHTRQLFEELIHVPLIMAGPLPPGLKPGAHVTQPHSLMELLPSILAWQGVELSGMQKSRTTLFAEKLRAPILSVTRGCSFDMDSLDSLLISLRQGDYKLIHDVSRDESRLFNLKKDPGEKNDLSAEKPDLTRRMRRRALDEMDASLKRNKMSKKSKGPSKQLRKQLKSLQYIH